MKVRITNKETETFWNRACSAVKFEQGGMWGLKSTSGDIVLPAEYDKIEICSDFIYVHYGTRHKFFFKQGGTSDCPDEDDDYRFYENGKIGITHQDGSAFLPAIYDEIIDWGNDCDVVYVRTRKEFHYYNHKREEILTDIEEIPEDEYPLRPYDLGEDQDRNVLLCIEPIKEKTTDRDCFAYGQWCRLSRIKCSDIRKLFSNCSITNVPSDAIEHFEDKNTYIYSSRVCTSRNEMPLTSIIEKLKSLECYDSSWIYLLKITKNDKTSIKPEDLYNLIKHIESLEDGECITYNIAIDIDETLQDDEVRLLQVHYFWDDMGAFLHDEFKQRILPDGSVSDIKAILDNKTEQERRKLLYDAFWWIKMSDVRNWDETKEVLEFLKAEGCKDMNTILTRNMDISPYWMEEISPEKWEFKKKIITWAVANGAQINRIHNGKTLLEEFTDDVMYAKEIDANDTETLASIKNAESFIEWFKSLGAITAAEQRRKIESRLEGLSPNEVLALVSTL